MNKLATPLLFGLLIATGPACDSNPTPHPGHNDVYKSEVLGPDSAYGEFNGDNPPGRGDDNGEDDDPTATPDNDGATGAMDNCPPGDEADASAADAAADVAEQDVADDDADAADDADDSDGSTADCGPEETAPAPGTADFDEELVE